MSDSTLHPIAHDVFRGNRVRRFFFARLLACLAACGLAASPDALFAGEVSIVAAKLSPDGTTWRADVTLRHADAGWEHYADAWRVVDAQGEVLGTRKLLHPHDDEQPFTRSLSGIEVPRSAPKVFIEAHDKVHGWSKTRFEIVVPFPQ